LLSPHPKNAKRQSDVIIARFSVINFLLKNVSGLYKKEHKMSVNLEKNEFRKSARAYLMRLAKFKAKCSHYQATKRLLNLINYTNSKKVLFYLPLNYEVDVLKIRRNLSHKCEIFAPFMVGLSLEMVRLRLPFLTYKFNVRQPSGKKMNNVKFKWGVKDGSEVVKLEPKLKQIGLINFTKKMAKILPLSKKIFIPIFWLMNNRLGMYTYNK